MVVRLFSLWALSLWAIWAAPITAGVGIPGVNPLAFRITTFTTGLSFPTVIDGATAGGILVAAGFQGRVSALSITTKTESRTPRAPH